MPHPRTDKAGKCPAVAWGGGGGGGGGAGLGAAGSWLMPDVLVDDLHHLFYAKFHIVK